MQTFKKNCRKSKSSLSFSDENVVSNGTNLRPINAMRRDERFLSTLVDPIPFVKLYS